MFLNWDFWNKWRKNKCRFLYTKSPVACPSKSKPQWFSKLDVIPSILQEVHYCLASCSSKGQVTCSHITHKLSMGYSPFAVNSEQIILSQHWVIPIDLLQSRNTWLQICCFPFINAYNTFHFGKCNATKPARNFSQDKNHPGVGDNQFIISRAIIWASRLPKEWSGTNIHSKKNQAFHLCSHLSLNLSSGA